MLYIIKFRKFYMFILNYKYLKKTLHILLIPTISFKFRVLGLFLKLQHIVLNT